MVVRIKTNFEITSFLGYIKYNFRVNGFMF